MMFCVGFECFASSTRTTLLGPTSENRRRQRLVSVLAHDTSMVNVSTVTDPRIVSLPSGERLHKDTAWHFFMLDSVPSRFRTPLGRVLRRGTPPCSVDGKPLRIFYSHRRKQQRNPKFGFDPNRCSREKKIDGQDGATEQQARGRRNG